MLLKSGSKGSLVLTMQKLLKSIGYDIVCDGYYGPKSEAIVKQFQEDALIKPIDGICGNKTYNALVKASKAVTHNYKEKIVWVNPKDLKGVLVKDTSTKLVTNYKNFINGAFFWYQENIGNKVIGWFYSEGKQIDYSNSNKYRGTFLVLKDGTTIAKRMKDSELMTIKDNIWFTIQGFNGINSNPDIEGTNTTEVGRKCLRPIIGYNPKSKMALIAAFNGDYTEIEDVLKKYECTMGIGLDGGGSTNMFVNSKSIYKTNRVLNNIIYW